MTRPRSQALSDAALSDGALSDGALSDGALSDGRLPAGAPTAELSLAALADDHAEDRAEELRAAHRALESALRPLLRRDRLDAILQRAHEAVLVEDAPDLAARLRQQVGARLLDAVADALDSARPSPRAATPDWVHHLPPTAQVELEALPEEATGRRRVRRDHDSLELDIDILVETA